MFQSAQSIRKRYDVSTSTLRRWAKEGKIRCLQTTHQRLYDAAQLGSILGDADAASAAGTSAAEPQTRETILYARVSSPKQKEP